jgi:hypothetical protein
MLVCRSCALTEYSYSVINCAALPVQVVLCNLSKQRRQQYRLGNGNRLRLDKHLLYIYINGMFLHIDLSSMEKGKTIS